MWGGSSTIIVEEIETPNNVYVLDLGGEKSSCYYTTNQAPTLTTTHYGEPVVAYERTNKSNNNINSNVKRL